jgi:dolichol-phosphate mannosyltransferase
MSASGDIRRPRLSVVSPCYNEEDGIDELFRRATNSCIVNVGADYEIVLVNDGSKDSTWQKIAELAKQDSHVVGVNLSRNHGHQLALSAGLHICRGERILIIDADLQDPPELLATMMERMDAGSEVVYGRRDKRDGETAFKRLTAKIFYRVLASLTDIEIPLDSGDFRLMSRTALDVLLSMPENHRFIRGMVSWIGFKQEAVIYDRAPRFAGITKYPLRKMVRFAFDAITSFSVRPLRWALYLGVIGALAGLVLAAYVFLMWSLGHVIQGWTSLMVVVLLLGSVQLFIMGIFGEYMGRMYLETKRRPLFIIKEIAANATVISPESYLAVSVCGSGN